MESDGEEKACDEIENIICSQTSRDIEQVQANPSYEANRKSI